METPSWCPFEGHKYDGRKPKKASVFEFSYKIVNTSLEEFIKIKVIFILRQGMAKSQKIGNVFSTHKSFLGRQLNAASRKS